MRSCVAPMKSYVASSSPVITRIGSPVRRSISPTAAALFFALRSAAVVNATTCVMLKASRKARNSLRISTALSMPCCCMTPSFRYAASPTVCFFFMSISTCVPSMR